MATTSPATDRPHKAATRYIYAWGEGTAEGDGGMKDLLGGKGAGLAEMTKAGLPTPPGFTITPLNSVTFDYLGAADAAQTYTMTNSTTGGTMTFSIALTGRVTGS